MKNKLIKVILLILVTLILSNLSMIFINKTHALTDVTEDLEYWEPTEDNNSANEINTRADVILGIIRIIGIITSVITLAIIALKFMYGSVEEKAEYKKTLLPWLIGAILVFSMSTLPGIIYDIVNGNGIMGTSINITLDKTDVTLKLGENEQVQLTATISPDSERVIKWSSSNTSVATVDPNGKVTARNTGTATITAYTGKASAKCIVTVEAANTTAISISKSSVTIEAPITMSYQLTATVTPSNSIDPVYWSSSNTSVAKVSNGKVTATGLGTTTITAKSGSKTATCQVEVVSPRVYEMRYYNPSTKEVSSAKTAENDLKFLIYIPQVHHVDNLDKLPMIVYLHGGNTQNFQAEGWTKGPFGLEDTNTNYPAICIFPICPTTDRGWELVDESVTNALLGLIDYTIANYNVDSNKIALTGPSNGAGGTWRLGIENPQLFSCLTIVARCTYSRTNADPQRTYPNCPVWILYSSRDGSRKPSQTMRNLLVDAGKEVKCENVGSYLHEEMVEKAYTRETINWMIARNKNTNAYYQFEKYDEYYYYEYSKKVSGTGDPNSNLGFWMYTPETTENKNKGKLPLIIYLHGGTRNGKLQKISDISIPSQFKQGDNPAVIIAPLCQEEGLGWHSWDYGPDMIKQLIDYAVANYNVDANRVALTGASNGAIATWEIGIKYPELFSCLVVVSGYKQTEGDETEFPTSCPVWLFGSDHSSDFSDSDSIERCQKIQEAGGQAKVTIFNECPHGDMPNRSYTREVINWMCQRSKLTNGTFRF